MMKVYNKKYRLAHATRKRYQGFILEASNMAFAELRTLPPDKEHSKIDILRLAICCIN